MIKATTKKLIKLQNSSLHIMQVVVMIFLLLEYRNHIWWHIK